ncbi:MAG: hypothetical protein HFE93_09990 [Acutalibacter muris]|nr:hypothetical protein [Acutalibacter muris]
MNGKAIAYYRGGLLGGAATFPGRAQDYARLWKNIQPEMAQENLPKDKQPAKTLSREKRKKDE